MCLRNIGYAEKLVYLNLIAFSKNPEVGNNLEHKQFNETHNTLMVNLIGILNIQIILIHFDLFKDQVSKINMNVHEMRKSQILQRMAHSSDSYYVEANNEYVQLYSIIQSCVIVICAIVQTYFIRKLFESPSYSSKGFSARA